MRHLRGRCGAAGSGGVRRDPDYAGRHARAGDASGRLRVCPEAPDRRRQERHIPTRHYALNGERRSFALLRPIVDTSAQEKVRQIVLDADAEFEERALSHKSIYRVHVVYIREFSGAPAIADRRERAARL